MPVDGYGRWDVSNGTGSVVQSNEVNGTAVTSVSSQYNEYTFTVSGLGCVAKTAVTTVVQSDPASVECAGCQIVSLGKDASGMDTFVNTCDPPVPMVVTSTDQPISFTVEITMKSLTVGSDADIVFSASVTLTGALKLGDGSTMSIGGNSTMTMQDLSVGNSTFSCADGATVVVRGNITSAGATFQITAGNMTILGSVAFDNATTFSASASDAGSLFVQGQMSFGGRLIMAVLQALAGAGGRRRASTTTSSLVVAQYGSSEGSFSSVNINYPPSQCSELVSATPSYGPSSMSVILAVRSLPACDSVTVQGAVADSGGEAAPITGTQGLSAEAIVGLVVSLVLVAAAVMVVAVLAAKAARIKRADAQFRSTQAAKHRSDLQVASSMESRASRIDSAAIKPNLKVNAAYGKEVEGPAPVAAAPAAPAAPAAASAAAPAAAAPPPAEDGRHYTTLFNASQLAIINKDKGEEDEGEEDDSNSSQPTPVSAARPNLVVPNSPPPPPPPLPVEEAPAVEVPRAPAIVEAAPVPVAPEPQGVAVVPANNREGFVEERILIL